MDTGYVVDKGDGTPTMVNGPVRVSGSQQAGQPPEPYVMRRIRRGEVVVRRNEPRWRELWAHFDGDQYVEVSAVDGTVQRVEVREGGRGKPRWRPRLVRNRMTKAIVSETSTIGSRVPQYEVDPLNADRNRRNSARLSEKVLLALHTSLRLQKLILLILQIAAVTGDGYAWAYWDSTIGDPVLDENGQATKLRTGDIRVKPLRQDQVMWQPNTRFEESRWHAVRVAKSVEAVMDAADYKGPKPDKDGSGGLKADAQTATIDLRDGDGRRDLVYVYHYLERPSQAFPSGRWLQIAGGYIIAPVYPFPCKQDRSVLHRLSWIERANRDRSLGAGEMAIDIQRSINRIVNQLIVWRNLVLNPQVMAPANSLKQRTLTEEPGKVFEYKPVAGQKPEWRQILETPQSLFRELDQCYADLEYVIGGGAQLPAGVVSGTGIQGVNEREQSVRGMVISNLAAFWSDLGEHLLYLVQQHYTDERLLRVQGRFGVEMIEDFRGEQIEGFSGVRVAEGSIVPRTRQEQEAKIMAFADKGWISPEAAMGALNGGDADVILDAFELDEAKAYRNIQGLIMLDAHTVHGTVPPDAETLIPQAGPMDNHAVHIDVLQRWMKTEDYERIHPFVQQAALALLAQHQQEQQTDALQAARLTQARAAAQGMNNAGSPQGPSAPPGGMPGVPSTPSVSTEGAQLAGAGR